MKSTLPFLRKIKKNNNTLWMHAHKDEYLKAKKEIEFLAQELIMRIGEWDPKLPHLEPKHCMFRFNRDTRFSENKKPYKENFGIYFSYGGKQSERPGYYLNIAPTEVFVAGGVWRPESPELLTIRRHILNEGSELKSIISAKPFKKNFKTLSSDHKLIRPPKGFPAEHEFLDFIKLKSFTVSAPLKAEDVTKPDFGKKVDSLFKLMRPLNHYLDVALGN